MSYTVLIFIIHVHYGGYDIDINVYIINDNVVDGTRTAPVIFLNNSSLFRGKEEVCFQPEIIDITVSTFKYDDNILSSDVLRSTYIISASYHNLWSMNRSQ